jgi:hypothetical protein
MKTFATSIAEDFGNGGVIDGDVTISGDLIVNGNGSGNYDEIVNGNLQVGSAARSATILEAQSDATKPSFTFTNDTNTGMGSASDNQINFITDGGTRMIIDAYGKVGIGVAPSNTLSLKGANANLLHFDPANAGIFASTAGLYIGGNNGNSSLIIGSSGSTPTFQANSGSELHLLGVNSVTTNQTIRSFFIDSNKSGVTASGQTANMFAVDIDMDDSATNHASGTVNMTGQRIVVTSANAQGTLANVGLDINVSGADTNHAIKVQATAGYNSFNVLQITDDPNVGISYNTTDSLSIRAGQDENIRLVAGGDVIFGGNAGTTSGKIYGEQGSATNPVYGFNGGDSWGIGSSGANILNFITASTSRMTINAAGEIGIGAAPISGVPLFVTGKIRTSDKLELSGNNHSITSATITSSAGSTSLFMNIRNDVGGDRGIIFTAGGAERMIIEGSGKVGFGTNTPSSSLEIQGGDGTTGAVLTLSTKETAVVDNDVLGRINFQAPLDTGVDSDIVSASIHAEANATFSDTVNSTDLVFSTGASEVATEKMRITSAGNVGIGTDLPSSGGSGSTLHIRNNLYLGSSGGFHGSINSDDSIYINMNANDGTQNTVIAFGEGGTGTTGTAIFKIDYNSRISLSNNDSGVQNTIFGHTAGDPDGAGDQNVFIGHLAAGAGTQTDAADNNVGIGWSALTSLTIGHNNTAIGKAAGYNIVDGTYNTAVGSGALDLCVDGVRNVSLGGLAHSNADTGNFNVAIGYQAGYVVTGDSNITIGDTAGVALNSGNQNILIGQSSGDALAGVQEGHVAIGSHALGRMATANEANHLTNDVKLANVALGYYALSSLSGGGDSNIAIGTYAYGGKTSGDVRGSDNVIIGTRAGKNLTDSDQNIVIGKDAFSTASTTSNVVAIGHEALKSVNATGANETVAIGHSALTALTSGTANTAIGFKAAAELSDNSHNTVVGYQAMYRSGATVYYNTFIGSNSGSGDWSGGAYSNTAVGAATMTGVMTGTAIGNIAVGRNALAAVTSGANNIAIGLNAGDAITSDARVIAIGSGAYSANDDTAGHSGTASEGSGNMAIGYNSMTAIAGSGAIKNTALGYETIADGAAISITDNTAIGFRALKSINNGSADANTAIGSEALTTLTLGASNTAVGYQAGDALTVGGHNALMGTSAGSAMVEDRNCVAIGYRALIQSNGGGSDGTATDTNNTAIGANAGDALTNGALNTFIGANTDGSGGSAVNQIVIGNGVTGIANNTAVIGNASVTDVYMGSDSGAAVRCGTLISAPDEITATNSGVAASILTLSTEVTTNGDGDLDNVTLANGTSGQIKHIYCVVEGASGDTWKITPATMCGGTQITFAGIGLGCTLVYADSEGWIVTGNNGGTIS